MVWTTWLECRLHLYQKSVQVFYRLIIWRCIVYWFHVGKDFHNIFGCEQVQNILWGTILSTQREETQIILIIKLSHNFLPTVKRNKIHTYLQNKRLVYRGKNCIFLRKQFLSQRRLNKLQSCNITYLMMGFRRDHSCSFRVPNYDIRIRPCGNAALVDGTVYSVRGDGYTFIQSCNAFLTPGRARRKS